MWWFVASAVAGSDPCDGIDNDGNGTIDDPEASIGSTQFATLGDAVAAAQDGDVVSVCSTRSIVADLVLGDQALTLVGVGPFGAATIIGAQQVTGSSQVRMTNLHLIDPPDPAAPGEPAVLVGEKGWLDVDDLLVDGSDPAVEVWGSFKATASRLTNSPVSSPRGAVLIQPGGTAQLGNTLVNESDTGVVMNGGLVAGGVIRDNGVGILVNKAVATVIGSTVTKNRFDGVDAVGSELNLNDVTVTDNEGTGVFLFEGDDEEQPGHAWISYSTIEGNRRGGLRTEVRVDMLDTLVTDNTGGGIATSADLFAADSSVIGNFANRGAGLLVVEAATVTGLRIAENTALVEGGGVVVDATDGVTVFDRLLVVDNEAGAQAGAILVRGDTTISNSGVLRNTAPIAGGALVTSGKHSLNSRCSSWGIRTDDNVVDDVVTDAGAWSVATDDFRCDSGGCVLSVALCDDPGGDVLDGR